MLGLAGFRVLGVAEVDGELEVTVETDAERVGCTGCGVRAESQGRRPVLVRDVDAFGRRARLRWVKRLWRCREPACARRTWTEQRPAVKGRAALTERARAQACRRVGRDGASVALVARDLGVGWHTVMRAVWAHGRRLVDDGDRLQDVTALGMDETAFLRAQRTRPTIFVCPGWSIPPPAVSWTWCRIAPRGSSRTGSPGGILPGWQQSGWSRLIRTAGTPTPSPLT